MLPLPIQLIVAMVAYAINERMARRIDYLLSEVPVLREVYTGTTGRRRVVFSDEQRSRLAIKGEGVDAQRTARLLPDCPAQHALGLVSSSGCQEVRQLNAAQETGQASQAEREP